jgi:hypothetical protein
VKLAEPRPYDDPDKAARKLVEICNSIEAVQDGRLHIEKINAPFLYQFGGSPAEYGAGLQRAIDNGWLWKHESGTYVKFTQAGRTYLPEAIQRHASRKRELKRDR